VVGGAQPRPHDSRLELKADDDLHLPLQALDYWSRVRQLQREHAFEKYGYFPGIELSDQPPLLYLVAPTLRIHPSSDVVLRHLSPEIPWEMIGLNRRLEEAHKGDPAQARTSRPGERAFGAKCLDRALSLDVIVRGFAGDDHVVHVALAQAGVGDAHKA
jgi:hypothetical protein